MQVKKTSGDEAAIVSAATAVVQRKLAIGAENDTLETEADDVADKVMRMPELLKSTIQGSGNGGSTVQRKCDDCDEEKIQRRPLASSITPFIQTKGADGSAAGDAVTDQVNTTKGSGSNMDSPTQSFMENRFGTDFSYVKIHTGDYAVQMSRELNAQAFTVGSDIYFNSGKYNPSSDSGKHLLAHELTHTVQQGGGTHSEVQRKIQVNPGLNLDTQGFTTSKTGDIYTCPAVVKGSLWNEIFTSLLHSPRIFKVAGSTDAEVKKNFMKHMKARFNVVEFASKKQYIFPKKVTGELMNPAFWEHDATGWHEKAGVDRKTAVNDLNINPKEYEIGCLLATKLTMEGGSKSSVLTRETGAANDDWIPGDWGYIKNTKFSGGYGLSGENLIYTGKDLFWGHFGPGNTYKSLTDWFTDVESWDGGAVIYTHRDHTDLGLE